MNREAKKCKSDIERSLLAMGVLISELEHSYHYNRGELILKDMQDVEKLVEKGITPWEFFDKYKK